VRVGAPSAVEHGYDRCGTNVWLLGSVKASHPSAVQQGGVGLYNVSLLLTATDLVRRVTAALARLRSRLFVESRCSRAQR
jgi:hypothetical protein